MVLANAGTQWIGAVGSRVAETSIGSVDQTVFPAARSSASIRAAILHSRHGTRWQLWDFLVGISAFYLSFQLSPYFVPGSELGGQVSTFLGKMLGVEVGSQLHQPQWYYYCLVGGLYGVILMISSRLCGVPMPERRSSNYELLTTSAVAVVLSFVVFMVIAGLAMLNPYGRFIIFGTVSASLFGIWLPRYLLQHLIQLQPVHIVLYGAGQAGEDCMKRIRNSPFFSLQGYLDQNGDLHNTNLQDAPIIGNIADFLAGKLDVKCDVVVICVAQNLDRDNAQSLQRLPLHGVEVLTMGSFIEFYFKEITLDYNCPYWLASQRSLPGNHSIFAAKRILDIVGALIGLVLTAPLWPLLALIIRLDSAGPVIFKQRRVGRWGKCFNILKFRTMRNDAEKDGAQWAVKNDPRVTSIGKFLRVTRLDEIPQLWNVLVGDMSLVGPRPERPEFVSELAQEMPMYNHRHLVPPGLTGWGQIRYRYGASKEDAKRKLEHELYYIRHLSVGFDFEIIFKTIPMLMKGSR